MGPIQLYKLCNSRRCYRPILSSKTTRLLAKSQNSKSLRFDKNHLETEIRVRQTVRDIYDTQRPVVTPLNDKIKFVIGDFKFTMINRKDLLLISGSISNSLNKYRPIKLEGKSIVLTTTNKLKILQNREVKQVMYSVGRVFRNKPELGETIQSITYLNQYLHTDNRIPIIVFWNGTTDKEILQKLGLNRKIDNNNNYFNLQLLNITGSTSKLLYSSKIGHHEKNG
ncbi:hypothetical protein AGLY_001773 [Aphis glycines]|uniref:Uncharacterized protein n=1 Tax=Aphis glycines TaxID=307491 RepID=A0A6G0U4T1_APHGL|nr:hypothetical protein AGLY_001773 [Aphis glycines]